MLRQFFRNSLIYNASNVLTKGISFFLLPLYTSILSEKDYGIMELVSLFSTLVIVFFSFQINQGVARYYNELRNLRHRQIYTSTVIFFSFISFAFFLTLSFIFEQFLAHELQATHAEFVTIVFSIFANALFYFFQNQLTWKLMPVQEMISSLTYNVLTISLTIVFLVGYDMKVQGVFLAQIIGAGAGISFSFLSARKDFRFVFSWKALQKILSFSLPLIPGALSIFVFIFTDRICIKKFLSIESLGVFSLGSKIASILTFVNAAFLTALSPLIYKHYKEKETPQKIAFIFKNFLLFSFLVMTFIAIFSSFIVKVFANERYYDAIAVIPFILVSLFLSTLAIFFPGLIIAKKSFKISIINIFGALLNLGLNLLLIRSAGLLGSALATSISYSITFALQYYFSQKEYWIPIHLYKFILVLVLYCLAVYFASLYRDNMLYLSFLFILFNTLALFLMYNLQELNTIAGRVKSLFQKL